MPRLRDDKVIDDPRSRRLAEWIDDTGRKVGWVARQLGYSKVWISYIVNGRQPMSDLLADKVEQTFGISMGRSQKW